MMGIAINVVGAAAAAEAEAVGEHNTSRKEEGRTGGREEALEGYLIFAKTDGGATDGRTDGERDRKGGKQKKARENRRSVRAPCVHEGNRGDPGGSQGCQMAPPPLHPGAILGKVA